MLQALRPRVDLGEDLASPAIAFLTVTDTAPDAAEKIDRAIAIMEPIDIAAERHCKKGSAGHLSMRWNQLQQPQCPGIIRG